MNATFDEVSQWSLPRIVAANDLIDAVASAEEEARAEAERERKRNGAS
jgi:hypothetical protein